MQTLDPTKANAFEEQKALALRTAPENLLLRTHGHTGLPHHPGHAPQSRQPPGKYSVHVYSVLGRFDDATIACQVGADIAGEGAVALAMDSFVAQRLAPDPDDCSQMVSHNRKTNSR